MALAPGVPFLVRAAGRTPGGSLGFAAMLAFVMPALSIVTIPLTARFIFAAGLIAPAEVAGNIPFGRILVTLVGFQLVPLLVGLLIANRAPKLAAKLRRPLLLLFFVAVVALLVILGPTLVKAVASVYGSRGIWAMVVLVLLSVGTGWILGGPSSPVPANAEHCHRASEYRNVRGRRDRDLPGHAGRSNGSDVLHHSVFHQHRFPRLLPPSGRAGDRSIRSMT